LLNAAIVNDYSIVTYQRPLKAADDFDRPIFVNKTQAIIWAIGPLNQRFEVSYHSTFLKKNKLIDFGRQPFWNCPIPEGEGKPSLVPHTEVESKRKQAPKGNQQQPQKGNLPPQKINQQPPQKVNQSQAPQRGQPQNGRKPAEQAQRRVQTTQRPVPTPKAASKAEAWEIPPIQCHEPEDGVFYAQMGPTGGKRGYPAITGKIHF
jgi:hypothetical protein